MLWFSSKKKPSPKKDSATIRAEALARMRTAREVIGEDTLERVAEALIRKQKSTIEQAKSRIESAEADRVAENILALLKENQNT